MSDERDDERVREPLKQAARNLVAVISQARESGLSAEEIAEAGGLSVEEVERILNHS